MLDDILKPKSLGHTKDLRQLSDRHFETIQEDFVEQALSFNPEEMGDLLFIPEELTYFFGEPIYEQLPPEKRIQLNRLSWCHTYSITMIGECGVNMVSTHNAYQHMKQGAAPMSFYALREVAEESVHTESFFIIIQKVLEHYRISYEGFFEKMGYAQEYYWDAFLMGHRMLGMLLGHYHFYYLSRYPMNLVGRSHEQVVAKAPYIHPVIRSLTQKHIVDETRHLAMSKKTGLSAINEDCPRWLANIAAITYALYAVGQRSYGPPRKQSISSKSPLIGLLEMCDVPSEEAKEAYHQYRRRIHQPELNPQIQKMRKYLLQQNLKYIDLFQVSNTTQRIARSILNRFS